MYSSNTRIKLSTEKSTTPQYRFVSQKYYTILRITCILSIRILHFKDTIKYTPIQTIRDVFQVNILRDKPTNISSLLVTPTAKYLKDDDVQDTD